ncbi:MULTISPECIES: methionine ABC transporter permease [Streptococcus]|jgi:D-methionine transport system permease protein|nr:MULTISPECIES: methionine ABC transporter permease [Streptococcus]MCO7178531.1 ABC transporter permease [Streptococcus gallolyticus]MCR5051151.1 ABC transporter permease [Streptococcus sp.]MCY7171179.1 ABC transporter permease [Streptococcus gallolyticus subsp. gallolyticus]MCY7187926.1 ABC transporter permease [Streptococcus gallolyticus subsp. gallolyticus]MCY7192200.1 ABC transporter permease [Streptococcus gallolyticus subsp. gallolyticus]
MSQYIIEAIQVGILETLEMTFFSALIAYLIGLPLGIILYATARGRLLENRIINLVLGVIVNILRSLPFLILLVLLIPFTRLVTGSSIGTIASIVPLTIGTVPIVARMVEASLCEVQPGIIEAATAMGASPFYIILHFILPEATPSLLQGAAINVATVLGYSAMAGVIGGGGLGAIALQYGYYRYQKDVLWSTVALLVIMVMIIQEVGNLIAKKKRKS